MQHELPSDCTLGDFHRQATDHSKHQRLGEDYSSYHHPIPRAAVDPYHSSTARPPPSFIEHAPAPHSSTRQTQLIKIAERLLQEYYTRLSHDPTALNEMYLDDAELIYTGQQLNVDAVYSTGKSEIDGFFQSETAAKFRGARFMVEALHPQASPTSPLGVVLFAKGRVWLSRDPNPNSKAFTPFNYVHFLSIAPPAKLTSYGALPPMLIANEYLHLLNYIGLSAAAMSNANLHAEGPMRISVSPQQAPVEKASSKIVPSLSSTEAMPSGPYVSAKHPQQQGESESSSAECPAVAPSAEDNNWSPFGKPSSSQQQHQESHVKGRVGEALSRKASAAEYSRQVGPPQNRRNTSTPKTLHAAPGFGPKISDEELAQSITECVKELGGSGSCVSITKPRQFNHEDAKYSYFFIHLDSADTMQLLHSTRQLSIQGTTVRVSPSYEKERRPFIPNHFYNRQRPFSQPTARGSNNRGSMGASFHSGGRQQQQQQDASPPLNNNDTTPNVIDGAIPHKPAVNRYRPTQPGRVVYGRGRGRQSGDGLDWKPKTTQKAID